MFCCFRKFSVGKTQIVVFHLLSNWISRKSPSMRSKTKKNYFGFTNAPSEVHFRSSEGQTFYWSIMTVDDSIKCRWANSGMTGQVGGFQNPGVSWSVRVSFLSSPSPPRSFTCSTFLAVFDFCSLFFSPKPHRNACYAGYDALSFLTLTSKLQRRSPIRGSPYG